MTGHFSGERLYQDISNGRVYIDMFLLIASCDHSVHAIMNASGKINKPPPHPISVECVFPVIV